MEGNGDQKVQKNGDHDHKKDNKEEGKGRNKEGDGDEQENDDNDREEDNKKGDDEQNKEGDGDEDVQENGDKKGDGDEGNGDDDDKKNGDDTKEPMEVDNDVDGLLEEKRVQLLRDNLQYLEVFLKDPPDYLYVNSEEDSDDASTYGPVDGYREDDVLLFEGTHGMPRPFHVGYGLKNFARDKMTTASCNLWYPILTHNDDDGTVHYGRKGDIEYTFVRWGQSLLDLIQLYTKDFEKRPAELTFPPTLEKLIVDGLEWLVARRGWNIETIIQWATRNDMKQIVPWLWNMYSNYRGVESPIYDKLLKSAQKYCGERFGVGAQDDVNKSLIEKGNALMNMMDERKSAPERVHGQYIEDDTKDQKWWSIQYVVHPRADSPHAFVMPGTVIFQKGEFNERQCFKLFSVNRRNMVNAPMIVFGDNLQNIQAHHNQRRIPTQDESDILAEWVDHFTIPVPTCNVIIDDGGKEQNRQWVHDDWKKEVDEAFNILQRHIRAGHDVVIPASVAEDKTTEQVIWHRIGTMATKRGMTLMDSMMIQHKINELIKISIGKQIHSENDVHRVGPHRNHPNASNTNSRYNTTTTNANIQQQMIGNNAAVGRRNMILEIAVKLKDMSLEDVDEAIFWICTGSNRQSQQQVC